MNRDIFEGKWKEMRGQVKEWWGDLTDDDLDKAGGKADQLRSKSGGVNSPTTTWTRRGARPISSSACSSRSMATPASKPKRNSIVG